MSQLGVWCLSRYGDCSFTNMADEIESLELLSYHCRMPPLFPDVTLVKVTEAARSPHSRRGHWGQTLVFPEGERAPQETYCLDGLGQRRSHATGSSNSCFPGEAAPS